MNVKKKDLVMQLCNDYNYTKGSAEQLIEDFVDIIITNMNQGNTVSLYGFGVFDMVERAARSCPNPQTGEPCHIPSHWTPRFYPGTRMKNAVKMWEDNVARGIK